jgi:hypothetical protein
VESSLSIVLGKNKVNLRDALCPADRTGVLYQVEC